MFIWPCGFFLEKDSLTVGDLKNDFNVEHEFKPLQFEFQLWKSKLKP